MTTSRSEADARLLFTLKWQGPWERLMAFFLGVRQDNSLRWSIKNEDGVLSRLSVWAERKDTAWKNRHLSRGTTPWPAWKRRAVNERKSRLNAMLGHGV
jgi:hypothetical protein